MNSSAVCATNSSEGKALVFGHIDNTAAHNLSSGVVVILFSRIGISPPINLTITHPLSYPPVEILFSVIKVTPTPSHGLSSPILSPTSAVEGTPSSSEAPTSTQTATTPSPTPPPTSDFKTDASVTSMEKTILAHVSCLLFFYKVSGGDFFCLFLVQIQKDKELNATYNLVRYHAFVCPVTNRF